MLIVSKVATLYELQTIYDYEDMLDMIEALAVCNYNEAEAMKAAMERGKHS